MGEGFGSLNPHPLVIQMMQIMMKCVRKRIFLLFSLEAAPQMQNWWLALALVGSIVTAAAAPRGRGASGRAHRERSVVGL